MSLILRRLHMRQYVKTLVDIQKTIVIVLVIIWAKASLFIGVDWIVCFELQFTTFGNCGEVQFQFCFNL